ncbi:ABC transporter family protein [Neorickettsia helminthoeca str. Oregon]|uniref:ABC transporter family protein n=1 Tax=Neorickettsia helminthoeca str. Oregon TaxID=1286528 RepID=X5H3X5_9RICK|nr:ABC transporter ATP-binding protein [Neorickettsia helminthoeca]AHX11398.1 ABC transporter family protein [Neorickettsia helminthoeca str. Oregon]
MSLSLQGVAHNYQNFSLKNICFDCDTGQIVCLIGESGSGKSTLLRLISGLESPIAGSIKILDKMVFHFSDKVSLPPEQRNIAMIFQHSSLFPNKTVFDNVQFAVNKGNPRKIASEMLELVGMSQYSNSMPFQISGGQQQLVTLARAFAQFPGILLLDEPFSSLDATLRMNIREKVISLIKEKGLTTVIVTHDPYEALEVSDKLVVIRDGKIIMTGLPDEVYDKPKDHKTAELFGIINPVEGRIVEGEFLCDFGKYQMNSRVPDAIAKNAYVRPEGIKVCSSAEGVEAVVCEVRKFSRMIRVELGGKRYWIKSFLDILPRKYDRIFLRLEVENLIFFN